VRAAILLREGVVEACDPPDEGLAERLRELALELLAAADRADDAEVAEVEATSSAGAVYAVRHDSRVLSVVAGGFSLSSLMRYDVRRALAGLEGGQG
jgi:hypothetical protein